MAHTTYTVGRLLCGQFRDYLKERKFLGMDIEYMESSGLTERTFTIRGADRDILSISRNLDNWITENDLQRTN